AQNASLKWAPWWILAGKLAFRHASADTLAITRRPSATQEPGGIPAKLHVPLRMRFWDTHAQTLLYTPAGGTLQTYHDAIVGIDFGARNWHLKLDRLQTRWGRLKTDGSIGTDAPHPTRIKFEMMPEGRVESVPPVEVKADATGDLELLKINVTAKAQASVAEGKFEVAPTAPQPVRTIDATLHDFDPHHLGDAIPLGRLVGGMKASTGSDGVLRGHIGIDNKARGLLNEKKLPLAALVAEVTASPERWSFDGIRIDFGDAGRITGNGWVNGQSADWRLATDALDLSRLSAALWSTHLVGSFISAGPLDAQHVVLNMRDGRVAFLVDGTAHPGKIEIARARAEANGGGAAEASGSFTMDATRAFDVKAALARFNPSAFGNYPTAVLNGKLAAQGALAPVLQVNAQGSISSSTLRNLPMAGRGTIITHGKTNPAIDIAMNGTVGATRVAAKGRVVDPKNLQALDLDLMLSGKTLAELYQATGLPFPETPPYRLSGLIGYHERTWSLKGFKGQVGRSDLEGDLAVELGRERPFMRANLTSTRLDIADLGGFIGAAPTERSATPSDRVLPRSEYHVEKLNAADADVHFVGRRIINPRLPLYRMDARLVLEHGVATLQPLDFKAAGGDIDARITMDARRKPIRTVADVQMRGLALNRLAPGIKAVMESAGSVDGRTLLTMTGNSVSEMLGSADGNMVLAMKGGKISDLVLRLANLDIQHTVGILARGDKPVPISCFVADFAVDDGVMKPRNMVLDSEHTVVRGEGTIDLGDEKLDMRLVAQPKDGSLLALRGPIKIDGTMAKPAVHPQLAGPLARAGAAVALGAIAPPLALLPLLEPGKKQAVDCEPLILDASRFIRTAPPPPLLEAHGAPKRRTASALP
ncbi:MAG TPA: AsmA family protein, partial [Casimicrobiaceae bacterium]|nr:AsmA family protein [Casimicrobiaceae bacterium]